MHSTGSNLCCLRSFPPLADRVLDVLTLQERLEPVGLDVREVHEQVLASIVRRDEAEPLLGIKPLDLTSAHCPTPSSLVRRNGDSLTSPESISPEGSRNTPRRNQENPTLARHRLSTKFWKKTLHFTRGVGGRFPGYLRPNAAPRASPGARGDAVSAPNEPYPPRDECIVALTDNRMTFHRLMPYASGFPSLRLS